MLVVSPTTSIAVNTTTFKLFTTILKSKLQSIPEIKKRNPRLRREIKLLTENSKKIEKKIKIKIKLI
jgi:hypothetical protein